MKIQVRFGALAAPLHQQLCLPARQAKSIQKSADAITLLAVKGLLSDTETHRARQRLMRMIVQTVGRAHHVAPRGSRR